MESTKLKTININFEKGHWDPRTQSLILEYSKDAPLGFTIRAIPIYGETSVDNTDLAKEVLRKFTK
jgi:hypothetical protein